MSFDSITSFLDRFKKITPPDEFVRKTAVEILREVIGVKLSISHISIEGGILHIRNNSFIKSEVFLHKEQILQLLKDRLKEQAPKDII